MDQWAEDFIRDFKGKVRRNLDTAAEKFAGKLRPILWKDQGDMIAGVKVIPTTVDSGNYFSARVHVPHPSQHLELGTDKRIAEPRIRQAHEAFRAEATEIITDMSDEEGF